MSHTFKTLTTSTAPPRRTRPGAVMTGAIIATATFGPGGAEAAPAAAPATSSLTSSSPARTRYEAAMAGLLEARRMAHAAGAAQQARAVQPFDVAAGPLASALASFETATGITVEVAASVMRDIDSPGVSGAFAPEQALQRILAGTGLAYRFVGPSTVRIDVPGQTDFVQVTASPTPVVRSPKFTSPLVDAPQTVSVIPGSVFNQQGAQNLTDVLRNTPGITFNAGENGFATPTSNFSLRGFDTSGSVFVDGARDSGNFFRDVFNLEQVEVVKGPSGDNGRGSAGGYVNLSTKSPRAEAFQTLSLGYGFDQYDSANRPRATIDVNRPINDSVAVRFNVLWQDGGLPGRQSVERNSWGVAPSITFGLGGPTQAVIAYQRVEQDGVPDWGVPGALIDGMIGYDAAAGGSANRARFYGHASDYDDVRSDSVLARVEHAFSRNVRLSNQTRWSDTEREALYAIPTGFTPATGLAATQRQAYSRENSTLSNLTTLSATFDTGSLHHTMASGLEISREASNANRYSTNGVLGNPGSVPVDSPDPGRPLTGFVGLVPVQTADISIDTVAAYVYDTVQLSSRWQVTGGLRLERYDVGLESRTAEGQSQGPDGFDRSDTTLSGKAGLVYKPAPNGSIYAAIGVATLPPASFLSNPDISRDGDNAFPGWSSGQNSAISKVQRSTNYEVGTKWDVFDQRFSATASLFRTERRNIAMAGTVDGVANMFAGYGRQVVQGIELGGSGSITPAWTVFGGLLLMDSERRHGPEVDAARLAANPGDYGTRTTTNGDRLAFSSNVTANLWTTYRLPVGLTLGGGLQHVGEAYLGRPDDAERIIPNGNAGVLPAYTVINALASYEVNRRLTLRFNVDNLANRFYAMSANWNGSRVTLGPARAFIVSTDLRF